MVGVGRAKARNRHLRLGPGGREAGGRMDTPADRLKASVEDQVGRGVGGGPVVTFDDAAVIESDNEHRLRAQFVIWHATWFDRHDARSAIDATGVAERQYD